MKRLEVSRHWKTQLLETSMLLPTSDVKCCKNTMKKKVETLNSRKNTVLLVTFSSKSDVKYCVFSEVERFNFFFHRVFAAFCIRGRQKRRGFRKL